MGKGVSRNKHIYTFRHCTLLYLSKLHKSKVYLRKHSHTQLNICVKYIYMKYIYIYTYDEQSIVMLAPCVDSFK